MWIKLIITIVTLFLLFDEYFKIFDKVIKKNRRRVVLLILAVLAVFSLIDVIIQVNEGENLVKKANTIIIQSDSLIGNTNSIIKDLERNIEKVEKSGKNIVVMDSVLRQVRDTVDNQVELLKRATKKSIELVRLEEKKFEQDEAKIYIPTISMKIVNNKDLDTSYYYFKFNYMNVGERTGTKLNFDIKGLYFDDFSDYRVFNLPMLSMEDIPARGGQQVFRKVNLDKSLFFSKNHWLLFSINCSYQDKITEKKISYKTVLISSKLKGEETKFVQIIDEVFANNINRKLFKLGLHDYLIEIK